MFVVEKHENRQLEVNFLLLKQIYIIRRIISTYIYIYISIYRYIYIYREREREMIHIYIIFFLAVLGFELRAS
jgi:hypothetical protein